MIPKSPLKAIKEHCKVECCVNDRKSWVNCTRDTCPLYAYRFGKKPKVFPLKYHKKEILEEDSNE